jgi:hypothetical protein
VSVYQSSLYLHIISPVFLLLNILIEIFLLATRSFQNIRRQYRVSVYQSSLYLHIISPVFLLLNILIEIFLLASRSFQNIRRQYRVSGYQSMLYTCTSSAPSSSCSTSS